MNYHCILSGLQNKLFEKKKPYNVGLLLAYKITGYELEEFSAIRGQEKRHSLKDALHEVLCYCRLDAA